MHKNWDLTAEEFDRLLAWLDLDRDQAAMKFIALKERIIKFLIARGCHEAEDVFYEAARRIAKKPPILFEEYAGDPARYFHGVARKVFLEWLAYQPEIVEPSPHLPTPNPNNKEIQSECLRHCLQQLAASDRMILEGYYGSEQPTQITARKRLAKELDLTDNALKLRVLRLKRSVGECMKKCLAEKII